MIGRTDFILTIFVSVAGGVLVGILIAKPVWDIVRKLDLILERTQKRSQEPP